VPGCVGGAAGREPQGPPHRANLGQYLCGAIFQCRIFGDAVATSWWAKVARRSPNALYPRRANREYLRRLRTPTLILGLVKLSDNLKAGEGQLLRSLFFCAVEQLGEEADEGDEFKSALGIVLNELVGTRITEAGDCPGE